ncbi:uncharacterized protein LOC135689406 [Rhopilema esculentum]|uniref:uncharacterized protein LOC135689406 n=1 Tax=Rhopilema esculentum TaxID=499914 RepID=UPI0031E43E4A
MSLLRHVVAIYIAFTACCYFARGSQEDYQLLEDSFAHAYVDDTPAQEPYRLHNVPETKRYTIARAQRYQRPAVRGYKYVTPAVLTPNVYNRLQQRNQAAASRRNLFAPRINPLLPQRKILMHSAPRNIATFARRDPKYMQRPSVVQAPRRSALASHRALNVYSPRANYMYNPRLYTNFYRPNPYMYAQRRNFMYPQLRPYNYVARRPLVYSQAMLRNRMLNFVYRAPLQLNMYRWNRPQRLLYARDHSWSGNHLNLNTGTSSHTVSNSVLKAPGHTTTDTHVVNKQQTGGRVRGVAPKYNGKNFSSSKPRYPFMGKGSRARGKVSASANVNAKASASTSSSSSSQSGSSSKTNGGLRTTSSGGWGGGAGAGWGSGPNAWGIGYGGGGGGSNWKIPSNMVGIPGMPGKFPGIPSGFPGMPPGGYPSKGYASGSPAANSKRPSSTLKGQKVSLKPKKGVNSKAFRAPKVKAKTSKVAAGKGKARPPMKAFSNRMKPKSTLPLKPEKIMRVQFFSSDPQRRPVSSQWQKIRQRIIADVIKG